MFVDLLEGNDNSRITQDKTNAFRSFSYYLCCVLIEFKLAMELYNPNLINVTLKIKGSLFFAQLRPPQPPVYLFVFDVSHNAIETGYLNTVCQTLLDNLDS